MWLEAAVFLLSLLLTFGVRKVATRRALFDIPNARSSHECPTPHGGGIAIVVTFYGALGWLFYSEGIEPGMFWALLCALPVVIVSFVDDIWSLPAKVRLAVQGGSAAMALYMLGGIDAIDVGFVTLTGGWLNVMAFVGILWLTNLYNFLDGIDGYAGSEALYVGVGAWLLLGSDIGLLVAAASLGFLLFNWHRASIFMGDVGSAPLGFIFAVLALHDAGSPDFIGWLVLLSLFWFDATVTLWRRWRNGERLYEAHKKHAYQRLHQAGFPHDRIVLLGMGLNGILFGLLWLAGPERYGFVFLAAIAILWLAMKYVDHQKAFR